MHIIAGKFKRRALAVPKTDAVRPTTSQLREALFNICQHTIEGSRFLDLFAGSGAMGLEALSRGAISATFVENNRLAVAAIKKNITLLQVEKETRVFALDVLKALQSLYRQKEKFEIIYVDPPYGEGKSVWVLEFLDKYSLLEENGLLFIEDSTLEVPHLQNLKLFGQRQVGRAVLYEFHPIPI